MRDNLKREGRIRRLPVNKKEIIDAFNLAKRDLDTARKIYAEDFDWAFAIAYNSMLQASRAFMFSEGWRPSGETQHVTVIKFVESVLGEKIKDKIIVLDRMRRKRHIAVYDEAGIVSEYEAEFAVKNAEEFLQEIEKILIKKGFLK